jgi:hypothetical protein
MVDPELVNAIGTVLSESDRPIGVRPIAIFIRPYVRCAAAVSDVQSHLLHLESRGDVRRHADPDEPSILSWSLTEAGKLRFK